MVEVLGAELLCPGRFEIVDCFADGMAAAPRDGVLIWTVEGTPTDVGPGQALCIRRGAVHQFENTTDAEARALAVVTPGILGPDYFREVAAVVEAAASGPPDLARIAAVMSRHGLTPAP